MEEWKKDSRSDVVMVDIDTLVPKDHLLRKIERVMDYDWLYERLSPYYLSRQRKERNRPGGAGEDGADTAPVRHSLAASDAP